MRRWLAEQGGWEGMREAAYERVGLVRTERLWPAVYTPEERAARLAEIDQQTSDAIAALQAAHDSIRPR